jgi:hypothetical protein
LCISILIVFIALTFNITFHWFVMLTNILFILLDLILYETIMHQGVELYKKI